MPKNNCFINKRRHHIIYKLNNGRDNAPIFVLIHGFAGNKDENGLFIEAEEYFSKRNVTVFRFDFEGAGESEGDYSQTTLSKQADDLESAIDYLVQRFPENDLCLIGFSLGATVSILKNDPRIKAYVFWSPALEPSKDMYPRYNTSEVQDKLSSVGFIDKAGLRVGGNILTDLRDCQLEPCIRGLQKPVLLIHGTADKRISFKTTKYYRTIFKNSKMVLIKKANHSYKNKAIYRKKLLDETFTFFQKHFPSLKNV